MKIRAIGEINPGPEGFEIKVDKEFAPGLMGLEGFSHIQVLWLAHRQYDLSLEEKLVNRKPYVKGPEKIGVFATRSQFRPNPISVTPVFVQKIDHERGIITTPYIDAEPGTPLLDIKPYHPCSDTVASALVPDWCGHWPKSVEESGTFDWSAEFNFPQ